VTLDQGARTGDVRDDIAPGELASYCLHALTAAGDLPSKAAVHRLVTVTLTGLRPDSADISERSRPAEDTGGSAHPPHHHVHHSAHGRRPAGS